MADALSKCTVIIDGEDETNIKSVTEHEVEPGRAVPLMNKTVFAQKTKRYTLSIEYVPPVTGARDWSSLVTTDGTVIIEDEGGETTTYYGVRLLKRGEKKYDGDNDVVIPIDLMATRRDPEL